MNNTSKNTALNVTAQAKEAENQINLFKKILSSDLIKKGFNVTVVHDSIIISKDKKECNNESS